jgi:hypothetical protein
LKHQNVKTSVQTPKPSAKDILQPSRPHSLCAIIS